MSLHNAKKIKEWILFRERVEMPKLKEVIFLEKRQHILMCARQVFASQGYETTKIQHILKAAGISNGALFVYFQSKKMIQSVLVLINLTVSINYLISSF